MRRPPMFFPMSLLLAATAWTLMLGFGEPAIGATAGAVLVIDIVVLTLVTIVGLVVAGAHWARWLGAVTLGFMAAAALTMPISEAWIGALLVTGLAVGAISAPSLHQHLRPTTGTAPPRRAVALPLLLLALPGAYAVASGSPWSLMGWLFLVLSPITAWAYGKAWPWGLWTARIAVPIIGGLAMIDLDRWPFFLFGSALATTAWLAWGRDPAVAIDHRGGGSSFFALPPELTPTEVLVTAGLDDRGRPVTDHSPPPSGLKPSGPSDA